MKKVFLLLAVSLVAFASCEKGDGLKPNPSGSVQADILENDGIVISSGGQNIAVVSWMEPENIKVNNFFTDGTNKVSICALGKVNGLGAIKEIPSTGFTTPALMNSSTKCEVRHGYVVKVEYGSATVYLRMYIEKTIVNKETEKNMGAVVRYQYPFTE